MWPSMWTTVACACLLTGPFASAVVIRAPSSSSSSSLRNNSPPPAPSPFPPFVSHSSSSSSPEEEPQALWVQAAWDYILGLDCTEVFFTTERECRRLQDKPKSQVAVYTAGPLPQGRLEAVLPDGGLSKAGAHAAVVVLDPYPSANFGHLVLAFFVDLHTSPLWCQRQGGTHLADNSCLLLALKNRCKNALERRMRRRNFARRCEVDFLPLVHLEEDVGRPKQLLTCQSNLAGFAPCPTLRPLNESDHLICNPLRDNTKRCEVSREVVHTSCRRFEKCDQAVLVSGGWDRFSSLPHHKENVVNMYHMLRAHGFKRRNIKVFFANGANGIEVENEPPHEMHPAALKLALRYHIQKMCGSPQCVDSLVLYLNGPGRSDGTTLLWDLDGDGQAEEKERYSLEELMSDTSDCNAGQVHLIADQSFSGEIARAMKRSNRHKTVVVYASSKDHEYSYGNFYTDHWAKTNHTHTCTQDVHKNIKKKDSLSSPEIAEGENTKSLTIFGAPCNVIPPFTQHELLEEYLGCQNVPTGALWVFKFVNSEDANSSEDVGGTSSSSRRHRGT